MDRLREKVKQILAVHTLFNVKPEGKKIFNS